MGSVTERRIFHNEQEVAHEAAEFIVWLAEQSMEADGAFRVALSGGSTPKRLYQTLSGPLFRKQIDWSVVEFYFGDERGVPPTHPESNFRMAQEALFKSLSIASGRVFRMPGEAHDLDAAASRYEHVMREQFNTPAPSWPRFHLILLGLGEDGHTASLFPRAPALQEVGRAVVASRSPKGVPNRLTCTLPLINQAAAVVFVVTGMGKTGVVKTVLEDRQAESTQYPAKLVRPHNGRLVWFLDHAAASELQPEKQQITYEEE